MWYEGVLFARQSRMRDALERWRLVASEPRDDSLSQKAKRAIAEAEAPLLQLAS